MADKPEKVVSEYELRDNNNNDEVICSIWWTGKSIVCSDDSIQKTLKGISIGELRFSDGQKFFDALPRHFRAGYTKLVRVK